MITVVAPLKNRDREPTEAFLKSLAGQTIVPEIIIVGYGSDAEHRAWERELCQTYGARLVEVRYNTEVFNQSRAHNIGTKLTTTPHVVFTDADLIWGEHVVAEAERVLTTNDNIMLFCQRYDIDWDGSVSEELHGRGAVGTFMGMAVEWMEKVGGFDEFYTIWGGFGIDLFDRAKQDGLKPLWLNKLSNKVTIHHQRHRGSPRVSGFVENPNNIAYYKKPNKSLVRNPEGWGIQHRSFEEVWASTTKVFGAFKTPEGERMYEIVDLLPQDAVIVEVGTFWGRSASLLGQMAMDRGYYLTCVDVFDPFPKTSWWASKGDGKDKVLVNLRDRDIDFTLMAMDSAEAARRFTGEIDLLFIDGDHRHKGVRRDCAAWLPKLKQGGYVLFHDYARHGHIGVTETVRKLEGYENLGVADSMMVMRKC